MVYKDFSFFENVYDVVRKIPFGKVTTYGAIARYLGATHSARMVGWALNKSFSQQNVPAHRVVNKNGRLSGKMHFESSSMMQLLLEKEGIQVENDKIMNFENHYWDPNQALVM